LIQGVGVFLKVFWAVELGGIDKNGNDGHVATGAGFGDQIQMPVMECTHSGNESNLLIISKVIEPEGVPFG
jgi:hypothetical protein